MRRDNATLRCSLSSLLLSLLATSLLQEEKVPLSHTVGVVRLFPTLKAQVCDLSEGE